MERILNLKLEDKTISKEESLENAPKLFEPIGQEIIKNSGRVEIENKDLKITMRYDEIRFSIDEIPRTEEEMIGTGLNIYERRLLKFLNFKPENFYELKYFLMENKLGPEKIELEEYDTRKERIFVLKDGKDTEGSSINIFQDYVKLTAEPKTAAAVLTAFHEIGHTKDPNISSLDALSFSIAGRDRKVEDKKIMDRERYAWAYSLNKLRPFLAGMNVDSKDLDTFIHERSLGSYSDFIKDKN
jgi:hypothetical protein